MRAMGPVKPAARISHRMNSLCTMTRFRRFQQAPGHGEALVIRPSFSRLHTPRVRQRRGAAVIFGFPQISRPNRRGEW